MSNTHTKELSKGGIVGYFAIATGMAEKIPYDFIALMARFAIASIFWRSMQTKIVNGELFNIQSFFFYQAAEDFSNVPLFSPDALAYTTVYAETILPIALALGLATRLSALAVIAMAATIQIFIFPQAYPDHLIWSTAAILLLARGAGKFSLDHLIKTRLLK